MTDDVMDDEQTTDGPRSKKPGMSTVGKVLLWLGCGGLAVGLICCGGGAYFATQMVKVTADANEIGVIREEIATIELPADMPPKMGMNMNMFFFKMKMVGFGDENAKFLMLMQMEVANANPADLEQQLQMQGNQQMNQQGKNVVITESEIKELTIDGQPRNFTFAKGTMDKNGAQIPVRQVTGTFVARGGVGMVIMIVPEEEWNEEETIQILESIHK